MVRKSESNEEFSARIMQEIAEDSAKMDAAILAVVREFAALENDMAAILQELLDGSWTYAAPLIYFAPASTETRVAIVDATFKNVRWPSDLRDRALYQWRKFLNRLAQTRNSRNKVIHGEVVNTTNRNGHGTRQRLTPATGDLARFVPMILSRQPLGMSAHDVQSIADTIRRLRADASEIRDLLRFTRLGEIETSLKTLEQLEDRHPKQETQSDAPTFPAHTAPPQS
jgi:hypothetical protein